MTDIEDIRQIILDKNGNIEKETFFDIETLNAKIIPASKRKQVRKIIIESDRIYKNSDLELNLELIRKYYDQIKTYSEANNKEHDITKERMREDWKICNYFQDNNRHKNKKVEISNFGRVKINEVIAIQDSISEDSGELYIKEFGKTLRVWTLVAKTWLALPPDDGYIYDVHHITNNGHDQRPENLIWLKRHQHRKIKHKTRI